MGVGRTRALFRIGHGLRSLPTEPSLFLLLGLASNGIFSLKKSCCRSKIPDVPGEVHIACTSKFQSFFLVKILACAVGETSMEIAGKMLWIPTT